jgi:predicted transcriptional regulator
LLTAVSRNYDVVMSSPRSVRLPDEVLRRLATVASRRGASVASVMERLIDEGLRREAHPGVTFRDGPSGRRAGLFAGPDVDEVVRTLRDVQTEEAAGSGATSVEAVAESLSLTVDQIRTAVAYYADHRDEIDARITANQQAADELEAAWHRQQEILAGSTP